MLIDTVATTPNKRNTRDKFKLIDTADIVVPPHYDHDHTFTMFCNEQRPLFDHYNQNISAANFRNASHKLIPNEQLTIHFFHIRESVTSEECLTHLRNENADLVSVHGLVVLWMQDKGKFPTNLWCVSFDESKALWYAEGFYRIPMIHRDRYGYFRFHIARFDGKWHADSCLLAFHRHKRKFDDEKWRMSL